MSLIKNWSQVFGLSITSETKTQFNSKSQKLFFQSGLTQINDGMAILLPPMVKSLQKLKKIVRREMDEISAEEILLPSLINSKLLNISGRIKLPDLFTLKEANQKIYVLSPTHEEAITNLVASFKTLKYSQLPFRFYQISNKFRDERRTKSGLLRCKEFIMKDLYSFDCSFEESEKFYAQVGNKYQHILQVLKVPFVSVKGCVGDIGGLYSHELHILSKVGEDKILMCQNCGNKENLQQLETSQNEVTCSSCKSTNVVIEKGIEIGHTFNLGTVYTKPFNACYMNKEQKPEILHMSCYGLGLTRLLAACVEVLCEDDKIRWPLAIAPYLVCVLPPKMGSHEEIKSQGLAEKLYHDLNNYLSGEVVYFDKTLLTIGKRLMEVNKFGFPFAVVVGKACLQDPPTVEVHDLYSQTVELVHVTDVTQFVLRKIGKHGNISI